MKAGAEDWIDGAWTVDCSCGVKFDDGEEMVSCDNCGVWVHTRCAKFVKLKWEQSFKCHNCKQLPPVPVSFPPEKEKEEEEEGERVGSDNEETEVAQLLAELPLKTGPAPIPPVRKWEVPLRDKVHVQGIPGGDPSLFQNNLTSAFNANLWRCTGYIPKKFGFQYLEFPCWKEGKEGERDGLFKEGADALFALSKQAEVAAVSSPQNVVRKIFQLGDTVERANKKKEKEKYRFKELSFGDCSSKKKKKDKNKDRNEKRRSSSSSFSIDVKQTCASISDREMQIEESVIPEGKSETKIEESNLSDNHYVDESFGDEEINKDLAEDLLNLSNVSKVLDRSNNNNNLPDIAEKTETIQSNKIQEKVKDESERETLLTQINNSTNLEKKIDINNVTVKTEEAKDKDNNSNKDPHIAQDDVSTTQHDVSKSEPGTDESNTGAPTPLPKPSSPPFNPLVHRGPGPSRTESATDQSKKHPIIYHAKTSASSLHKSNQVSKINASSCSNTGLKSNKAAETNLSQHVVKPTATCHIVDESTSSTSRKQGSDALDPPANLSDEQLALLLHQQLNSSPRVPRVPRLRHTPAGPTAHPTPTSVLSKRSSRDHPSGAKKKLRGEEITRESSRDSSGLNNERGLNKSTGQSKSTSVNSDKKPPAQQSPTVSSTEAATSGNPQVVEPGDCTSQKYPSLPGLIDEVLNATPHVTYEEICRNVSMHWNNLRKPNGERYAYTSPTHAVHDILRNRKEWAHLIDQAPKAYKRKNVIMTEEKTEEKSEESDSVGKDFPKGKRKARKRRRLDNKSIREMKKKNLGSESPGSESPSDSSTDNEEEGKHDDEMLSSDDVSGAQTAGSSSSD